VLSDVRNSDFVLKIEFCLTTIDDLQVLYAVESSDWLRFIWDESDAFLFDNECIVRFLKIIEWEFLVGSCLFVHVVSVSEL
jgi:hypothetical protein